MTANFIANICDKSLDNLDVTDTDVRTNGIERYNTACTLLDRYILRHFLSFEMTEQVYRYAKELCERRIKFENWYRRIGYVYKDRIAAYKEFGGNLNWLQAHKRNKCV